MKEEDKIQKKIGTENPFRVPEGYFENLTSEVMNRLPEKEKLIAVQTEPLTSEVMNRLPEKEKLIAVQTEPTMCRR